MSFDRQHANRQRELLAREIVALADQQVHTVVELPTGTGKGRICADIIRSSRSTKKWLVLVPETVQVENYIADLCKHGNGDLLETRIEAVICYASLKKYQWKDLNIHLNECHRVSDLRMDYINNISFDQIVSDSATISREVKERLGLIHSFQLFKKTLQEVIDLGILPEPRIQVVPILLDDEDKIYEARYGTKSVWMHARGYYDYLDKQITYWQERYLDEEEGGKEWQKNKWMQAAMDRKRWLANYKTLEAEDYICKQFHGKRYVCFCGSVLQARELGGHLAIHSKNTKRENQEIIEDFNSGISNCLYSCMMGVEGMNFTDVDAGLLVQLDNADRLPLQKTGRILRSDIPELHVLYVPGTQDEKYLVKFLSHFNPQYIQGYEIKQEEDQKTQAPSGISGQKRKSN